MIRLCMRAPQAHVLSDPHPQHISLLSGYSKYIGSDGYPGYTNGVVFSLASHILLVDNNHWTMLTATPS